MSVTDETGSDDSTDSQTQAITERIDRSVWYGRPTCDECYDMHRDDRPADGDGFWPDQPVVYVNAEQQKMCKKVDGEWKKRRNYRCKHHDTDEHTPDEATHRVVVEPEYIGDEHRMNSAYQCEVLEISEVEQ